MRILIWWVISICITDAFIQLGKAWVACRQTFLAQHHRFTPNSISMLLFATQRILIQYRNEHKTVAQTTKIQLILWSSCLISTATVSYRTCIEISLNVIHYCAIIIAQSNRETGLVILPPTSPASGQSKTTFSINNSS